MGESIREASRSLRILESVRCLDCDSIYAKPSAGGTAVTNPGCPECGYLGWIPLSRRAGAQPLHSGADLLPRRPA